MDIFFCKADPSWRYWAIAGLGVWALVNAAFTSSGTDGLPGVGLLLGFMGAAAIVTAGSLLAGQRWAEFLRYCGANSIVIYLSFFLPMKVAIKLLASTGLITDVGWASLLVTGVAVVFPLIFYWFVRGSWLVFLYQRPVSLRLGAGEAQAARL